MSSQLLPRVVMSCALGAVLRLHPLVAAEAAGTVPVSGDPAAQLLTRLGAIARLAGAPLTVPPSR